MKLLIMQSAPASRHFAPLGPKYSPQHPKNYYGDQIKEGTMDGTGSTHGSNKKCIPNFFVGKPKGET